MLNINQLRIFYEVARTKSVVRAAEKLFISQPAISNGLKKFQQQYGISLFIKEGRNLVLSSAGQQLYDISKKIFSSEKEAEDLLSSLGTPNNITLDIGLVTLYERTGLAELIEKFKEINSKIKLSVHSGNSRSLLEHLVSGEIDLAIASNNYVIGSVLGLSYYYKTHQIYLIVPKGHSLFTKKYFYPAMIRGEKVLLKETGSAMRATIDRYLHDNNIDMEVFAEFSNFDAMLDVMLRNNCVAFFPDAIISSLALDESMFSILEPKPHQIEFSTYLYLRKLSSYPENHKKYINDIIKYFDKK